jgi:hypothetical protein
MTAKYTDAQNAVIEVEYWNRTYPVGTKVALRLDGGATKITRTRYPAQVANSGHAVCFFEGVTGYYLLDRAIPIDPRIDKLLTMLEKLEKLESIEDVN